LNTDGILIIKRGIHFIEVAFFLSKFGQQDPPKFLQTNSWREAYHMFYENLNEGRNISSFERSLKNARDAFDSHFTETKREGWKDSNGNPNKLSRLSQEIFNFLSQYSENIIWDRISKFSNLEIKKFEFVFENLAAIEDSETDESLSKTEGGLKVFISHRIERNPTLRNKALSIHGYDCIVCDFNFEKTYGVWGINWAEVHHLNPISENKNEKRETNPHKDLCVVCANCHRMIHRKRGLVLTIDELKKKMKS